MHTTVLYKENNPMSFQTTLILVLFKATFRCQGVYVTIVGTVSFINYLPGISVSTTMQ